MGNLHIRLALWLVDQVSLKENGSFATRDAEVFEKLQQAVQGTKDILDRVLRAGRRGHYHAVVPVVVVPNDRLWGIRYSESGDMEGPPERFEILPLFIGRRWDLRRVLTHEFRVSHVELVVESALITLIDALTGQSGVFSRVRQ